MTDKKLPLTNANTWIRFAYMLLFTVLLMAARLVITVVVVVQFILVLLTGSDNKNLRDLGQGLGKWVYQTLMFLTFNSEDKSFPFDEWPKVDSSEGYSANAVDEEESVVEGEYVKAEEDVADDDIPSFTAEESNAESVTDETAK